jgi:hypothetical protein
MNKNNKEKQLKDVLKKYFEIKFMSKKHDI